MRRTAALALALLAACAHKPDPHAGTASADSTVATPSAPAAPSASTASPVGLSPGRDTLRRRPGPASQVPGPTDVNTGDASVQDSSRLSQMESEARALARADGCTQASQCRVAPVGTRACGGPRTYVAYCAARTDSAAFYGKLEELKRAETDYNRRHAMMSTCEYRMPPAVALRGGRCVAEAPSNRGEVPQ